MEKQITEKQYASWLDTFQYRVIHLTSNAYHHGEKSGCYHKTGKAECIIMTQKLYFHQNH